MQVFRLNFWIIRKRDTLNFILNCWKDSAG